MERYLRTAGAESAFLVRVVESPRAGCAQELKKSDLSEDGERETDDLRVDRKRRAGPEQQQTRELVLCGRDRL